MPTAERYTDAGEQPEPHDDRELRPTTDLEVVMDRRHAQHPFAKPAVRDDLRDHRKRLDHREAGEKRQEQMGAGQQREAGHRAADRERARIAHEDARGRGVPPEEPRARAEHRGRDDRLVERLGREHLATADGRIP